MEFSTTIPCVLWSLTVLFQLRWIDDGVFDAFAVVGVDDVEEAVFGLDDGGVGVLAEVAAAVGVFGVGAGFVFEGEDGFPFFAVLGDGEVEDAAGFENGAVLLLDGSFGVIVDDELAAVVEGKRVGAGVGIGKIGGGGTEVSRSGDHRCSRPECD